MPAPLSYSASVMAAVSESDYEVEKKPFLTPLSMV